ncbi:hypothetical protein ACFFSW_26600 [Saccharothrix longispora]|uniref:GrpE protein n=1 Tax=Saccharothrix longispora TaxID=33920 RepID=A0ABU1PZ72_9PSEU|nr:hypothetical protein [Saccharothrix longispora]MDR6595573.1 hypothetical protein [Saccharothrix longispora]
MSKGPVVVGAVVLAALGAFAALGALLAPGAPPTDARALAGTALVAARDVPGADPGADPGDPDAVAAAVARVLPEGTRAVVVRPGRANEAPTRSGTHRVAVVVGEVDRAAVSLLVANGGVVGSAATPDGWWAAVSAPASVAAPVGPALALLVAAVLLGAAAAELPRDRPAPRRGDALVRGVVGLLPHMPEDVAWRTRDVLAANGVRPLVPDGRRVGARCRVVSTEVTDDPALVGTVARTLRPGYAEGERVVVPARVVAYVAREVGPEGGRRG